MAMLNNQMVIWGNHGKSLGNPPQIKILMATFPKKNGSLQLGKSWENMENPLSMSVFFGGGTHL